MGLIGGLIELMFGGGRNVVKDTAEVFRENAEAGAQRAVGMQQATLAQFSGEFRAGSSGFDRIMDGVNRLPRPALALGTLGLFVTAMRDPVWFAERMQGLSLVPEPLWWLLGVIVSFYFGARHQLKAQNFQRDIAATMARAPQVLENLAELQTLTADSPQVADTGADASATLSAVEPSENRALEDWKALQAA
ncbi:MAG: holin family protein [Paracoccaceae bacterium]